MTDADARPGHEAESFSATYCENCGQLVEASDEIEAAVNEPVHRVEILEAIGDIDNVGETVAEELRECECRGQVVKRWYAYPASALKETDYDPDPSQFSGRGPDKDALIAFSNNPEADDYQELRDIPGLEAGGQSDE